MITWLQLWPLLALPFFLLTVLGFLPTTELAGRVFGGGPIREAMLNTVVPFLPSQHGHTLILWFESATTRQELALHALISLNVNALLLPLLYAIGEAWIRFRAWVVRTNLDLRQRAARR